jgi:hypothetical protein
MAAQYAAGEEADEQETQDDEEEEAAVMAAQYAAAESDVVGGADDGSVHINDPKQAEEEEEKGTKKQGDILKIPQPPPKQPRSKMSTHYMLLSKKKTKLATALSIPYTSNIKEVPPSTLYNFVIRDILQAAAGTGDIGGASQSTDDKAANPTGEDYCDHKMGMIVVAGTGVLGNTQTLEGDDHDVLSGHSDAPSAPTNPTGHSDVTNPSTPISPSAQGRRIPPLTNHIAMSGTKQPARALAAVLESKVDQFLGRGLGEAFSQAVLAGRRCVLLTRGKDTEVVSRVTKAIDSWQLPAVFTVGVSFIDEKAEELSIDVGSLNDNTHRHIFLRKPLQNDVEYGGTDSTAGASAICDCAEAIGVIFQNLVTSNESQPVHSTTIAQMREQGMLAKHSGTINRTKVDYNGTDTSRAVHYVIISDMSESTKCRDEMDQLDARFATIYKPHGARRSLLHQECSGFTHWRELYDPTPSGEMNQEHSETTPSARWKNAGNGGPENTELTAAVGQRWQTRWNRGKLGVLAQVRAKKRAETKMRATKSALRRNLHRRSSAILMSQMAAKLKKITPVESQVVTGNSTAPMSNKAPYLGANAASGNFHAAVTNVVVESNTSISAGGAADATVKAVYGVTRGDLPNVTYVMLLINGGRTARLDMLHAVRMGWDIIVFKGTGGFADEVANERERRATQHEHAEGDIDEGGGDGLFGEREETQALFDSTLDEILTFGKINAINLAQDSVEDVTSLCVSRIHRVGEHVNEGGDRVLFQAWQTYAIYSKTAHELSVSHTRIEVISMVLKLATVVLLAVDTQFGQKAEKGGIGGGQLNFLTGFIAAGPVLVAVLTAIKNHFSYGIKYIIMHGAAEQMRSQIFSYRSGAGKYSDKHFSGSRLASTMRRITGDVIKSECQNVSLQSLEQHQVTYRLPVRDIAGIRLRVYHMVCQNRKWDLIDMVLILSSALCLALSFTGLTAKSSWATAILEHRYGQNFFYALAFTLQLVLNITGFGPAQFWRQWWMRFDTAIVFITWLDYTIDFGEYARFIRMIRIARLGKLLAKSAGAMDKKQRQKTLNLHAKDPALSTIDAGDYISFRLDKALNEMKMDTNFLHTHYTCFAMFTYLLTGVTAILGLTDMGIWAVVAIACSNFCNQLLVLNQSEVRLKSANETVLQLVSTRAWWNALSSSDHIKQQNLTRLVEGTEKLIDSYITSSLSALKTAIDDEEEEEENPKKKKQHKKNEILRRNQQVEVEAEKKGQSTSQTALAITAAN